MASLFFWRKRAPAPTPADAAVPADVTAPAAASLAAAAPAAAPTVLPVQRMVLAIALEDPRAADPALQPDAAQMQVILAASRELARVGTEPRYTPHRPSILPQLLELVNDEDASLRALSRLVSQDPQLTGDLLRTANSPMYRVSPTPVESVERAAALLGTSGMRSLIAAALVQPLATGGGHPGRFSDTLWEFALYGASAAEAWAARSQDADPFAAHLLALMHGLGSVTVYRVLGDLYAAQPALPRDALTMAVALDTNAAVTAARIATNWGLSARTSQALEAQSSAAPVVDPSPLARALQFGLLTGAVTLLCRHGRLDEQQATAQLAAAGFTGTQVERIWDRLVRAYVRP